jgi:tRNA(Arg) A34 adenosine deaminase TadA
MGEAQSIQERFMHEAVRCAVDKMRAGQGGPFGAIVVKDRVIVGWGSNRVTATNDPTAHAEVVAIRDACERLGAFQLEGCELYASCEPCPMCLGAIYWARIARLYFAATRADAAQAGFDDDWIYQEIALPAAQRRLLSSQLLREQALAVFAEWKHRTDKTPY